MVIKGKPVFFFGEKELRQWFRQHHSAAEEIWIGFTKPKAEKQALSYKKILDEALCYGWIDGIRKTINDKYWMIRWTPRRKNSTWSSVNMKRMNELIAMKRVKTSGMKVFGSRNESRSGIYSFENETKEFSPVMKNIFAKNKKAWKWFAEQPPYYRKTATFWVVSAKKEETRQKRLSELIRDSAAGKKIKALSYKGT